MRIIFRALLVLAAVFSFSIWAEFDSNSTAQAQEPGWYPYVIARGQERDRIQNTPMHQRPYRPLHFYGNTVRRMHYRGTAMPAPRDLYNSTRTIVSSRRSGTRR